MADEPERRLRQWLRWAVGGLVGLELLYLAAANAFLQLDAGRSLINRRPEKLVVSWESAQTWVPGLVHVTGLDLGGSSRRVAWKARMDHGTMLLWLPSLANRHVRVLRGSPVGVEADIDLLPAPEAPRARKRGWRVTLEGLRLEDLRRVRTGPYELMGSGRLEGGAAFQIRGPMELHLEGLRFDGARLLAGGAVVADRLDLEASFETAPYRAGKNRVIDLLGGATGRAQVGAHADSLGFLAGYLRGVDWLGLGGRGDLQLTVAMDGGALQPGSSLSVTGPGIRADFFDFRATGSGSITAEVPAEGGEVRLAALFDRYSVTRLSDGAELLAGEGLETRLATRSTGLGELPTDFAGSVSVPSARATSVATLSTYLPPGLNASVTDGEAELSLDLVYDTAARSGEGRLRIDARDVRGAVGDAEISGGLRLDVEMPRISLLEGSFDVSGTSLALSGLRVALQGRERARDWWGNLQVSSGAVQRRLLTEGRRPVKQAPARVTAELQGRLRDTSPLVVLMEQRLPKLRWFDQLLTVEEIEMAGTITLDGPAVGLEGIHVTGGKKDHVEIRADLDLAGAETSGVAYVRYRVLDATLALNKGDRSWRLRRARKAWEEASADYRASRSGG